MQRLPFLALAVSGVVFLAGCTTGTNSNDGGAHGAMGDGDLKAQALALYTFKPFSTPKDKTPNNTPEHSWLQMDANTLTFLHWNHADPEKATGLLFTGDGVKGRICAGEAGITKAQYDAGFVHFHSAVADNWDAGHGAAGTNGDPATEGWWLRHIGAGDMTMKMMGEEMTIQKGKVFPLMPVGFENLKPC